MKQMDWQTLAFKNYSTLIDFFLTYAAKNPSYAK